MNNKGFTLLELLLVTTLTFCIGSVSLWSVNYIRDLRFEVVVDEIYQSFVQARNISYATDSSAVLTYDEQSHSIVIRTFNEHHLPFENILIELPSFVEANLNQSLRFNGNLSSASSGTLTLTHGNRTRSMTVRPVSGKITLY